MADLLPEKSMISQKISSFFKKTFAGGTGSILGGIFLGDLLTHYCGRDVIWWLSATQTTTQIKTQNRNIIMNQANREQHVTELNLKNNF